jgi:hypothetical protein
MENDFWPSVYAVVDDLLSLSRIYPSFKLARISLHDLAHREQSMGDEDDFTRELCTSLLQLFITAASMKPSLDYPTDINALAKELNDVTMEMDDCLIDYRRAAWLARKNRDHVSYAKEHEEHKVAIEEKLALLRVKVAECVEVGKTLTLYQPPAVAFPPPFDPMTFSAASHVLSSDNRNYVLCGGPKRGPRHVVWEVQKLYKPSEKLSMDRPSYAAKFYNDQTVFQRECDALKKIHKHPHVVSLVASVTDDAKIHPYSVVIMNYCAYTLEEFWSEARARHTLMDVRTVLGQVIDGLEHCHKQGIVHTNLRPKNIMRIRSHSAQDTWVIVDFDSAVAVGESIVWDGRTHDYVSPELARARKAGKQLSATPSLDMWGVGRILYFLATSEAFWATATTDEQVMDCLVSGTYKRLPNMDLVNERLRDGLHNLLESEPSERWKIDQFKASNFMSQEGRPMTSSAMNAPTTSSLVHPDKSRVMIVDVVEACRRGVSLSFSSDARSYLHWMRR